MGCDRRDRQHIDPTDNDRLYLRVAVPLCTRLGSLPIRARAGHELSKGAAVIDERNHIRLWLSPVTYKGVSVWVGHISRDAGVKFSGRFWPPTTHVIDPAVDEARFFVEQDLLYSQRVERIGLVEGAGAAPSGSPRTNAEGDPYFTDGLRAVFFIGKSLKSIEELEVLNWSLPAKLEPFREDIFGKPKEPIKVHQ